MVEASLAGLTEVLEFRSTPSAKNNSDPLSRSILSGEGVSFRKFIFGERQNQKYLLIAIVGGILQFIILKLLFPFPDFISDSYSYIDTATNNMDVNLWPIGYSRFMLAIHQFTNSDTTLLALQHIILELSLIYFFYTVLYFYRPSKITAIILFIFLFFNPLFLYLSNCVLSDTIFTALTMVWLTQLLWMFHRPRPYQMVLIPILIGACFTLRYTAMYYPIINALAYLLSKQRILVKIGGSIAPLLLMIPFVLFTQEKTKDITGTAQFSVFGGWQLANNALYMYGHIDVDSSQLPVDTRELDKMVKLYFKVVKPTDYDFATLPGTYFIKIPYAPLKQYMVDRYTFNDPVSQFASWGMVSPMYNEYAEYLIKHYPLAFARYYLLLNVQNYFLPHLEKFGSYNVGQDKVWPSAQKWFQYKSAKVYTAFKQFPDTLFMVYKPVFAILNIYFAFAFIALLVSGKLRRMETRLKKSVLLVAGFLLVNFGFSVFATPVVLRYQVIPLILLFTFSLLFLEYTDKSIKSSH